MQSKKYFSFISMIRVSEAPNYNIYGLFRALDSLESGLWIMSTVILAFFALPESNLLALSTVILAFPVLLGSSLQVLLTFAVFPGPSLQIMSTVTLTFLVLPRSGVWETFTGI